VRRLLVTASLVPSSPILVTLMMEALKSSETSVLTRAIGRNISEDDIIHSHRREYLKSYNIYEDCSLPFCGTAQSDSLTPAFTLSASKGSSEAWASTVKPQIIVFVVGPGRERWIRETERRETIYNRILGTTEIQRWI
jgi:hypothetical protein